MIHGLKYGGLTELTGILGKMLILAAWQNQLTDLVVVPVPLHSQRLAERGFNQAQLLGEWVAKNMDWPLENLLLRSRDTQTQTDLTRQQRQVNVANAFVCRSDAAGRTILLVDDVMTTSATLEECARALKQAGAKRVWALVVAKS